MVKKFYKWLILPVIWLYSPLCVGQEKTKDSIPEYSILFKEACLLIDSGKYKASIPLLKKAVKRKPDYWEALNKMAFAKIKLKDHKGAEKDLLLSDKIAPLNYEGVKLAGINYYLNNQFKESKAKIDTAIFINEEEKLDDPEVFYYRAQLMFKGKAYKIALEALETCTDLKPKYVEAISLKGEIRFTMKDYNYAIKELNQAIALMTVTNTDYKSYKLRAKSKFEVGDYKGAIKDWNVYIDAIPKEEEALVSRAAAKINVNDNTGAIADLDEAIQLNPKNPVSFCYRGVAKGGNKNYIEALKDLDFSIKLKFDYSAAYVNRAAIKMASNNRRGACEDLEKADGLGDEMAIKLIERYCKNH